MHKAVISDTSCLIVLTNIDELELLHNLYEEIITTEEVAMEYGQTLPAWLSVLDVKNKEQQHTLEFEVDKGEASAKSKCSNGYISE